MGHSTSQNPKTGNGSQAKQQLRGKMEIFHSGPSKYFQEFVHLVRSMPMSNCAETVTSRKNLVLSCVLFFFFF